MLGLSGRTVHRFHQHLRPGRLRGDRDGAPAAGRAPTIAAASNHLSHTSQHSAGLGGRSSGEEEHVIST